MVYKIMLGKMKQVILVRKDLKMSLGKAAAQVAHASLNAALKSRKNKLNKWLSTGAKKVVLEVANLQELLFYKRAAKKEKLNFSLIVDAGKTVFKEPTTTCLAIGPEEEKKIDLLTKNLKML